MPAMNASSPIPVFREPTLAEKFFNRAFGLKHNYLLQVRGRKSGRLYSTPINLLETGSRKFLIAPRGRTQWVRNVEVAGEVMLKKGNRLQRFRALAIPEAQRPVLLKLYVERFTTTVQRYFPVAAGSPREDFRLIAANYPVFELVQA